MIYVFNSVFGTGTCMDLNSWLLFWSAAHFWIDASNLSVWLCFAWRILVKVLCDDIKGQVVFPCDDEITTFQAATEAKYSCLKNCWGAMDRLKLLLKRSCDEMIQNMFYNGWTHDHYVQKS